MSTKLAGILDKLEKENGATAKYHDGLPRSGVMIEVPVSDPTNLRKGITRSALEFMLKTERNNDNLEWYYTIESRSVESVS